MITTILWDVDATLLDFLAAEKAAIKKLFQEFDLGECTDCLLYTSPSPRDGATSRMPSSA